MPLPVESFKTARPPQDICIETLKLEVVPECQAEKVQLSSIELSLIAPSNIHTAKQMLPSIPIVGYTVSISAGMTNMVHELSKWMNTTVDAASRACLGPFSILAHPLPLPSCAHPTVTALHAAG